MEEPPIPTPPLPRVTIQFCTQCKWMLRAAYFAQELLSTFSTSLGEVALQPSTGGTFIVHLYHSATSPQEDEANQTPPQIQQYVLWDRKAEGGFPETKELKRRVRDIIDPSRDLGHVDGKKKSTPTTTNTQTDPSSSSNNNAPSTLSNYKLTQQEQQEQGQEQGQGQQQPQSEAAPLPRAINRLQLNENEYELRVDSSGSRKFTPMDVDTEPTSGKVRVDGQEDGGACKPGDECWEG